MTGNEFLETPARSTSLDAPDRAYEKVLLMITSGVLPAGTWLREQVLAERIGVSRTPIREVLNRLAAEGVVEMSRNKGARVTSFSPSDVAALYDLRARFEPHAALLAVPRMSSEDVDQLAQLSGQMEVIVSEGTGLEHLSAFNNAFHALFVERCGNRHLAIALQAVVRPAIVARTFREYSAHALRRSMLHHAELVVAAEARDGEWAEAVMRAHILAARHATGSYDHDHP